MGKWRTYEWLVFNYICRHSGNQWKVEFDAKLIGEAKSVRQVDIYIVDTKLPFDVAVDCKCYNKSIDIKKVEEFIGMLDDLKVDKGILVTLIGYTEGAVNRAKNYGSLELWTLNIEELFPYRFDNNPMTYMGCPMCNGKRNIFTKKKIRSTVVTNEYDIVYWHNMNSFVKVNVGVYVKLNLGQLPIQF